MSANCGYTGTLQKFPRGIIPKELMYPIKNDEDFMPETNIDPSMVIYKLSHKVTDGSDY